MRGRDDALLKDIERLHAEKIVLDDDTRAEVDAELALFGPIKEMHRIMLALQVQDVTSQQLAVANHLIG